MSLTVSAQPETRLTGRRLSLARGVWIVVVALALGLYLFSIPLQLAYYQIVCSGAACLADQISRAGIEQLQQTGLSLAFYAAYFTALNVIVVLALSTVAGVIFWRKSDDWMGIFASITLVVIGSAGNSVPLTLVGNLHAVLFYLSSFVTFLGGTCLVLFFYTGLSLKFPELSKIRPDSPCFRVLHKANLYGAAHYVFLVIFRTLGKPALHITKRLF